MIFIVIVCIAYALLASLLLIGLAWSAHKGDTMRFGTQRPDHRQAEADRQEPLVVYRANLPGDPNDRNRAGLPEERVVRNAT